MQSLAIKSPELTVGATGADVVGTAGVAIQSALHIAAKRNINVVRILKGEYLLKNSIILSQGMTLCGEGEDTILKKDIFSESPLVADANWYQRTVKVKEPHLFPIGCGVRLLGLHCLMDKEMNVRATVIAREDNTLILDRKYLGENLWLTRGTPRVTTQFPLICAEDADDLTVSSLQLDGGLDSLDPGSRYAAGISLQNCDRISVRNVYAHHLGGDAMDWQICDDVTVEDSRFECCSGLGLHPGSGSQHTRVRNCKVLNNVHGFFFCWGVQYGCLEDCEIAGNGDYGVSVGFRDSHNVIKNNHIHDNSHVGVHFRAAHHHGQSPVDVLVEGNHIENNGPDNAPLGILFEYAPNDIRIIGNEITDNRNAPNGVAIKIEKTVRSVSVEGNNISGFAQDMVDLRQDGSRESRG